MPTLDRKTTQKLLKTAVHIGALIPLALIIWDYTQGGLGADPIRELTLRTGNTAIILLMMSLAVTPAIIWLDWKQLLPTRRLLGLYTFMYVAIHLSIFVWLDYGLNVSLIKEALFEKWYALIGFSAFLILLPLALTSSRWSMRKLGKNWKKLHSWVYLAGILAVLHYFFLVKHTYNQPIIFALILTFLLLTRVKPIKQAILHRRRGWQSRLSKRIVVSRTAGQAKES